MKKDIHPKYRAVIFKDVSSNATFLTRSTVRTEDTIVWEDGKEYPLVKVQISSASHPFFTGKQTFLDTTGRIDRFKKKFGENLALGSQKKRKVATPAKPSQEILTQDKKAQAKEALLKKFKKK